MAIFRLTNLFVCVILISYVMFAEHANRVNGGKLSMINTQKIAATAVAADTAAVCVGCNRAMAYPLTIDGVPVKAGIYIYYSYAAYSEAISTIQEQNEDLDTTDNDLVKEQIIDGVDTLTWIQNKINGVLQRVCRSAEGFRGKRSFSDKRGDG